MIDLLSIYWCTVLAATVFAGGLALLGAQLAARDRAMQTMCLGQGALLGVLLGIGLGQTLHLADLWQNVLPFLLAFLGAGVTFLMSEKIAYDRAASSTHFTAIFASLLAAGYLCSALFPALESHMTQKYFGDLATVTTNASYAIAGLGILLLSVFIFKSQTITRDSFDQSILGVHHKPARWTFTVFVLIVLAASVQLVGFLFTTACLFVPTTILSLGTITGLTRHLYTCAAVAMMASLVGFVMSLWLSRLPTTPLVVLTMVLLSCACTKPWRKAFYH